MHIINKIKTFGAVVLLLIHTVACKKFVEVDPPRTDLISTAVFTNDGTASAAMTDIYYQIGNNGFASGDINSITFLASLSCDELVNGISYVDDFQQFNENTITAVNSKVGFLWQDMYKCIYKCNALLEGLASSTGLSEPLKKQLTGEAHFFRAFCHFYLLNLFGDVPLAISTSYKINAVLPRMAKSEVYQQVINDLKEAQELLLDDYSFSNNEKIRANRAAATAFLARVYLFADDWINAEIQASAVINNSNYALEPDLDDVFRKNSDEAILQFYLPESFGGYTPDIITFIGYGSYLQPSFVTSFELADQRRIKWMESGVWSPFDYPMKYKDIDGLSTEYSMVLRLAEQFLIRAEARAKQDKLTGANSAASDIDIIRNRAGLDNTTAVTLPELLVAIEQERKVELFTEWGHRWFDLKRTNRADAEMAPIKPNWVSTASLYPIPEVQIQNDPNVTQNPGY